MFRSVKLHSQLLKKSLFETLTLLALITISVGCNLKKPVTEAPMENPQNISKDFFVDPKTNVAKTFMFGISAEVETGAWEGFVTHGAQSVDHANIVFEIQESALVGRLVNPSFPNTPNKWEVAITIPIKSHYYYEKKKDDYGREGNEYIENSSRSHWSARPFMKLDLAGLSFHKSSYDPMWWGGMVAISLKEIEWDSKNNFLGFSLTANNSRLGSLVQGDFRVNFKGFTHNPKFKRTQFKDENYRYLNALHVMGEKYDGLKQMMYAAHWDLEKTHKITLFGFPDEETKQIARDVIDDWNKTLVKVGAAKPGVVPFVVDEKVQQKHAFDLRNPTIYWVNDKRISEFSPLGIGLAIADLKNGEILWGGITLYGGLIKDYINSSLSPTVTVETAKKKARQQFYDRLNLKSSLFKSPPFFEDANQKISMARTEMMVRDAFLRQVDAKSKTDVKGEKQPIDMKELSQISQMVSNTIVSDYMSTINQSKLEIKNVLQPNYLNQILALPTFLTESQTMPEEMKYERKSSAQLEKEIVGFYNKKLDMDRTFAAVGPEWAAALATQKTRVTRQAALRTLIKELTSHEYGHFLGLGHQFKENILPVQGTVPEDIYQTLKKRSTEAAGMRNFTSVMGYRSAHSEFVTPYEEVVPGPHDELVLRFLYKSEVATFKTGDKDFKYHTLPDGIIPSEISGAPVTFFPQCNDLDASLSLDPYCNRWDRGSTAVEIVDHYFKNINDNIIQSHIAFTDGRTSEPGMKDYYTFYKAMTNLGRVRLFYDFMRHRYKKVFEGMSNDKSELVDFSSTCQGESNNEKIAKILSDYPELKDLCIANGNAIKGFSNLIALPISDYTKVDIDNRFSPGGISAGDIDRNYSKIFGSWTEAGASYLKIFALYALKTSRPWMDWYGMWTVPNYDNPQHRYTYATIYPLESTKVVSDTIVNNLKFKARGDDKTVLGQAVLMAGLFSDLDYESNDSLRFSKDYLQELKKQTEFGFSIKALIMKKPDIYTNEIYVKGFQGKLFNFSSNDMEAISEIFVLPGGYAIAYDEKSFLLPMTQMKFYSDNEAYTFAIQINYSTDDNSKIANIGAKKTLQELHLEVVNTCLDGRTNNQGQFNGLRNYFTDTNPEFKGFYLPPMISKEKDMYDKFIDSVKVNFDQYELSKKFEGNQPSRTQCLEAVRGIGNIVATSAILQGYITEQLIENLEK